MKIIADLEYRPGFRLTRQGAVALFVDTLEKSGAIFMLKADHTFSCNLDAVRDIDDAQAEELARAILGLHHEIRVELIGRRIAH